MISLVATILNERQTIEGWIRGLINQTVLPNEIVIVDGGSTDGTLEWLENFVLNYPFIKVLRHNGNIAVGRNFAIKNALGDIIVVADAGCFYDKNWFEKITLPFANGSLWTTTGFAPWFLKNDRLLAYLIAASTIPAKNEFDKNWLPSSRSVAFKKEIWQSVGGYPERIPICEDVVFDMDIIKKYGNPDYIRETLVLWRPRLNFKSYFIQLYKYTKGDGQAGIFYGRQFIRYLTYFLALILLAAVFTVSKLLIIPILFGGIIYCYKFYLRWFEFTKSLSFIKKYAGLILVPLVVLFGDLAKMCGWPAGIYEKNIGNIKLK